MPEQKSEYFIPARPQIAIEITDSGEVEINIWVAGDEVEHHKIVVDAACAKEFANGILYVLKQEEIATE